MTDGEQGQDLELAATLRAIRGELRQARDEGAEEELRFRLGPVELELQIEVSNENGMNGGIKVWVVSLGGRASRSTARTHTLRLTLHPIDPAGQDVEIHGTTGSTPVG